MKQGKKHKKWAREERQGTGQVEKRIDTITKYNRPTSVWKSTVRKWKTREQKVKRNSRKWKRKKEHIRRDRNGSDRRGKARQTARQSKKDTTREKKGNSRRSELKRWQGESRQEWKERNKLWRIQEKKVGKI